MEQKGNRSVNLSCFVKTKEVCRAEVKTAHLRVRLRKAGVMWVMTRITLCSFFCLDRKKLKKRDRGVVGLSSDSWWVFYYGCGQVGLTPPRGPCSGPQCPAFDCGLWPMVPHWCNGSTSGDSIHPDPCAGQWGLAEKGQGGDWRAETSSFFFFDVSFLLCVCVCVCVCLWSGQAEAAQKPFVERAVIQY